MGNAQDKTSNSASLPQESPILQLHRTTHRYLLGVSGARDNGSSAVHLDVLKNHLLVKNSQFAETFTESITSRLANKEGITEQEFTDIGEELASLNPGSLKWTEYYTNHLASGPSELSKCDVLTILESVYCVACTLNKIEACCDDVGGKFGPVLDSLFGRDETVSRTTFSSWIHRHASLFFTSVHTWLLQRWRTPAPHHTDDHEQTPFLEVMSSNKSLLSTDTVFLLSCTLPLVYTSTDHGETGSMSSLFHWQSLYDSNIHGLSINRFDHHVFAYKGPTVSLVSFEDHVYLIAAQEEWRDSIDRWGGQNSLMLELKPKYRIIQGGAPLSFLNVSSRAVPKGFQFGKDSRSVMLEIDEDMLNVKHYGIGIKLDRMEVWGCGPPSLREDQLKQKQWEQNDIQKHKDRKLKLDDWKDSPDRMLLELGGVKVTYSEEHPNE